MSYVRVLPRDLFNEANLLKCYGQLWLLTEGRRDAGFREEAMPGAFAIVQDDSDGSLTIANLTFGVRGEAYRLRRPLNARSRWPLYLERDADTEIDVFDGVGQLSLRMRRFLEGDS